MIRSYFSATERIDLMNSGILVRGTVTSSFSFPGLICLKAGEIDLRAGRNGREKERRHCQ